MAATPPTDLGSLILIALSAALAATPFGLPVAILSLGTFFCALGVLGRTAFDIQRAIETDGKVQIARVIGWAGAGFLGSPMAAVIVIGGVKAAGAIFGVSVQPDTASIFGCLAFGFSGPRAIAWFWGLVGGFVNGWIKRFIPGAPPPPPMGDKDGTGKP